MCKATLLIHPTVINPLHPKTPHHQPFLTRFLAQFCNNCNGEGSILKDGVNLRCVCDKGLGGCFVLELQYEAFFNEIESIMYIGDNYSFYELLFCEIIDPKNETKN